jgi:hypothetical protein
MSAFIVGHDHIDALLTFAVSRGGSCHGTASFYDENRSERIYITEENATEIGRILVAENERSVAHRYNETPGSAADYRFKRWLALPLSAVSVLKGCDCFDYQACETEDYEASPAKTIIDSIRRAAIHRLPGYEDAPGWGFRRPAAVQKKYA